MTGKVYLVGAGPGNPDLISVRGLACVRRAQVLVYDRLVARSLLAETAPDCERIYVGKEGHGCHAMSQAAISALLVHKAREGLRVCRLKGGDPFVFGRGGEEALACRAAGIPFEVVPGITAGTAAPAFAGIPVTHRGLATAVTFTTGHEGAISADIDWQSLGASSATLVFYMGLGRLPLLQEQLLRHGRAPETPAAVIQWGACPEQRVATGTLAALPELGEGMNQPALVLVGAVAGLREQLAWADALPLTGRRVLLCATDPAGEELAESIRDAGGEPWRFPRLPGGPYPHEVELVQAELATGAIHQVQVASAADLDLLVTAVGAAALQLVPVIAATPAAAAALARLREAVS